jgi:hypothetical protein
MTPGWAEQRLGALESRVEYLIRYLQDLIPQLRNAQQSARTANQQYPSFGAGVSGSALFCQPSGIVSGATGSWPTLSPISFTADVYSVSGTTITILAASATIYNWFPASLAASKVVYVVPDGAGNYVAVTQSCT